LNDGRPLNAVLESFSLYELCFDLGHNKKMVIMKHAISSIEFTENVQKSEGDRGGPGSFR